MNIKSPFSLPFFPHLSCCEYLAHVCRRKKELKARTVWLGHPEKCEEKYPKNAIKNQKYNILTFVPGVSAVHTWNTREYGEGCLLFIARETSFKVVKLVIRAGQMTNSLLQYAFQTYD